MSNLPNTSTLLTGFFYLIPIYLFILEPLARQLFPSLTTDTATITTTDSIWGSEYIPDYDEHGNEIPALNLKDDSFISPDDDVPLDCPAREKGEGEFGVHILSREPLVMYLENFLSDREADHLVDVSVGKYTPSIVYDGTTQRIDPSVRLSDRALLSRDNTVRCIEERARAFQGYKPDLYIERMWAQRYNASGHYRHHYDWAGSAARGGDRLSTFMVYLAAECEGGGTNFPRLQMPASRKWCRFLECDSHTTEGRREGVTFKAIKGNAIFWENVRADGRGIAETWHGAERVKRGVKVGLNIWSWYQPSRHSHQG